MLTCTLVGRTAQSSAAQGAAWSTSSGATDGGKKNTVARADGATATADRRDFISTRKHRVLRTKRVSSSGPRAEMIGGLLGIPTRRGKRTRLELARTEGGAEALHLHTHGRALRRNEFASDMGRATLATTFEGGDLVGRRSVGQVDGDGVHVSPEGAAIHGAVRGQVEHVPLGPLRPGESCFSSIDSQTGQERAPPDGRYCCSGQTRTWCTSRPSDATQRAVSAVIISFLRTELICAARSVST